MNVAVFAATDARLLKRGCESLIGICGGLVADRELNDMEIQFLRVWLRENEALANTWPGEVVLKRIEAALADGVVSAEERSYLVDTLKELVGGSFSETGAVPAQATSLPINADAEVAFPDQTFCFTGQFLYGTRSACEKAVTDRGGQIAPVSKKLKYLVVGELSSRDWKHTSFGTKIESALAWQSKGAALAIVSESKWVQSL
jgi:NAD-dependent DNA ligase